MPEVSASTLQERAVAIFHAVQTGKGDRHVRRPKLADRLALRITKLVQTGSYRAGDRLPTIAAMAKEYRVGPPTMREALRKLEAVGMVDIRHGSGVFIRGEPDTFIVSNPIVDRPVDKKLLVDLIEARIPLEVTTVTLAATNATREDIAELRKHLTEAGNALDDLATLNRANLAFHRQIAAASGNMVLRQLLEVLSSLFREEQRTILDIHGSRMHDHAEHLAIFDALERRDTKLAARRMRRHLEGVRDVLLRWNSDFAPPIET